MLHSMTIRLIHVHQLGPLPMLLGLIPIWGHLASLGSKGHFHQKCYTLSVTLHDHIYIVTLTYPLASNPLSHLRDQQATWGQSGVEVSKPAGYAVCDGSNV